MAEVSGGRLQLPHVNLLEKVNLSEAKFQCLTEHHNTILDGLTVTPWLLEELSARQLLTSRQKRNVDAVEDQRAKSGLILDQVYRGSNGMYDSFQQALRATNQEKLADLIQPNENATDLSTKTEQDMVVRLQKNKSRLKSELDNLEQLLTIMVADDLISRDERETALLRGPEIGIDRLLELLYTKGLSVMQHFLRILSYQGYSGLAEDIEKTSTDVQVTIKSPGAVEVPETLSVIVRMIKITRQQQKQLVALPNELKSAFRPQSGKITKLLLSRYKLTLTTADFADDGHFKIEVKFEGGAPLILLKTEYHNGLLNNVCNEKIRGEKFIKRSDSKWLFAFHLKVADIQRIIDILERSTQQNSTQRSSVAESEDEESEEEESEEADSEEDRADSIDRRGVRLKLHKPLDCGCNGDGMCVQRTKRPVEEGHEHEETIAYNVLINKVKSHIIKGKTKEYNYSANEIFQEIRSRQPLDYTPLQDNNGYNVLHIVVLEGRMELLQVLFNTGIFAELVDSKVSSSKSNLYNMTPMDIARKFRMNKTQDEITRFGRLERSMPMMHKMARVGDTEAVMQLIQRHPQMMGTPVQDGSVALYWGVLSGEEKVVKALLKAGADVHAKTYENETMLGCAVRYSHKDLVRLLVEDHGVDPEEPSAEDKTPVTIAIENKDFQVLRQLVEVGAEIKPYNLSQIVNAGRRDCYLYVLSQFPNLNIDYKDAKGKTALLYACEKANKDIFVDLVKRKADLSAKDKRERNIIFAAIESGDFDFFMIVLDQAKRSGLLTKLLGEKDNYVGSERCFLVSGRDKGILGFHYLEVFRVYLDIFRGIIRSGGACDVAKYGEVFKSGWGVPPPEVKKEVDQRYDPSVKSFEKNPDMMPLHFTLVKEQPKMALALLEAGADVDTPDHFGLRPVHLGCMRGYLDVLAKLEEKRANFNVHENFGMTPETVAEANRHYSLEHFFTGSEDIKDDKLQQFRTNVKRLLDELDDRKLHTERRKGRNVRQFIVSKLRDMTTEINFFLFKLGTSQIREETKRASEESLLDDYELGMPVQEESFDESGNLTVSTSELRQ